MRMSYYKELKRMNRYVEDKIRKYKEISAKQLIYQATNTFEVSTKAVKERIRLLIEIGKVEDVGGQLVWLEWLETQKKASKKE